MQASFSIDRRTVLQFPLAAALASCAGSRAQESPHGAVPTDKRVVLLPAVNTWLSEPPQVPVTETMVDVGGASLWAWDTGGTGPAVLLLHASTGSGAAWRYQQPVLANAGYRVIGFSRRGYYRSETRDKSISGTMGSDVRKVADLTDFIWWARPWGASPRLNLRWPVQIGLPA